MGHHEFPQEYAPDLVALHPRRQDHATNWFLRALLATWCREQPNGTYNYREASLTRAMKYANALGPLITSSLAALMPIVSVTILYLIPGMTVRLGLTAAFNVMFSLAISRCPNIRSSEVFAATAA